MLLHGPAGSQASTRTHRRCAALGHHHAPSPVAWTAIGASNSAHRAAARTTTHAAPHPAADNAPWALTSVQTPQEGALTLTDPSQAPTPDEFSAIEFSELSPKQLAGAIWSFAKQGSAPSSELMDAIAAEVHSKLGQFRSQDLSNTVWALAVLKYQPSASWWDAFERQVYVNLTEFTDRELGNLMWSLAVLDHRPVWLLEPLLATAAADFPTYRAGSLHLVGWACGRLRFCPGPDWLASYLRSVQANFFGLAPNEMSNIIWALAKLGLKLPATWLDHFLMVAQWRFPSFTAKSLSVIAWAVASVDHTPSHEWLLSYEQQVREKFVAFGGQELVCVAWALRRWGYSGEDNAVLYMLDRQEEFQEVDWQTLSNSKLLEQVITWKQGSSVDAY